MYSEDRRPDANVKSPRFADRVASSVISSSLRDMGRGCVGRSNVSGVRKEIWQAQRSSGCRRMDSLSEPKSARASSSWPRWWRCWSASGAIRRASLNVRRNSSDSTAKVARANTAKSEFLANISHELRTPLNAIVGFVELLKDGVYGELSPRQVPPVDRIAASATHLRHLVDQVLDIAKIAAGRLEVHAETIVLRPFVLNVASELESLVNERGLSFSIAIGTSLPRVRTDPAHLRQILINLIGNAVKFTPSGGIAVRARLVGSTTNNGAAAAQHTGRSDARDQSAG